MIKGMTAFTVRPITQSERRAAYYVLLRALHGPLLSDERWGRVGDTFPADRRFGAFDGDMLIGIAGSVGTELAVPGGKMVTMAAVDGVAVRADRTRRGVVTQLMNEQLRDCVRRGDLVAGLHASEATIYGRFGYGVATRGKTVVIDRGRARLRPEVPRSGAVRILGDEDAVALIPGIHRRIGAHRPGMMVRPETWWPKDHDRHVGDGGFLVAVHSDDAGEDDGFVVYKAVDERSFDAPKRGAVIEVRDMHAADPVALAGLWRFLLSVDLVAEVRVAVCPVDEPVEQMLTDSRACQVRGIRDELWLRLVDVAGALDARTFGQADPVVLGVSDELLPENEGSYRVTADGVDRTDAAPEVIMNVETLAMCYLGEFTPSVLATVGRVEGDAAALSRLDELFRTPARPWCGTHF